MLRLRSMVNPKIALLKIVSNIPQEQIEKAIFLVRGHRVILDSDIAQIFAVQTKYLNLQVKRNKDRFPEDFMFQLGENELKELQTQNASVNFHGGRRTKPFVFTEHGTVMLASVLNSAVAVNASIQVVRAFVSLRKMMFSQVEFAQKLDQLEKKYDHQFKVVFDVLRQLTITPEISKKRIGIKQDD